MGGGERFRGNLIRGVKGCSGALRQMPHVAYETFCFQVFVRWRQRAFGLEIHFECLLTRVAIPDFPNRPPLDDQTLIVSYKGSVG